MRAAADEVRHARHSFELASHFAGRVVEPGPLPAAAVDQLQSQVSRRRGWWLPTVPLTTPPLQSIDELATSVLLEAGVGETMSVLRAAARLDNEALSARERQVLVGIVLDETRHAGSSPPVDVSALA